MRIGRKYDHRAMQVAVGRSRGWQSIFHGNSVVEQMSERGWTYEQVVDELIVIEMDAWRLAAESLPP